MTYRVPDGPYKVLHKSTISKLFAVRWPEPSASDVSELWKAMTFKYGTTVIDRRSAADMKAITDSLDSLHFNTERFLNEFVLTVGDKIYCPFTPGIPAGKWDLWQQTMVCGHEHHHIWQDRQQEGILYEYTYSSNSTKRAFYEMEAYRVNMTLDWHFYGSMLDPAVLAIMLRDYNCNEADVSMVEKMLRLSLISIKKGATPSPVCQFEKQWLEARWG